MIKKLKFSTLQFLYFALVLCVGLGIKYFYSIADNEQLRFILFPIQTFIALQTGVQGIFEADKGYVFTDLNICIDKSCAGLNFLVIAFVSCNFAVIRHTRQAKYIPLYLLVLLFVSFFITILANTSRILIALLSLKVMPTLAKQTWFHEAQGAFIFVSVLLLFYWGVLYFIEKQIREFRK